MPILNRAAEMQDEIAGWRRHLHSIPELNFDLYETSAFVAQKLKEFGCDEVATGIARTGVVGIIKGRRGDGSTIGLRADMDALPILEATSKAYASQRAGKMHACGHDGHTAMLLGAAKYLTETRNFPGTVAVIFQPAEEGGGGGNVMVQEGMMERFAIGKVFGMHNMPGLPIGEFAIRPGPIMAATAEFTVKVKGKGGHAAMPHRTIDPIVVASQMVTSLQTIASRTTDPVESIVVSVTKIPRRRRLQCHSRNGGIRRNRAHAEERGCGAGGGAYPRDLPGHCRRLWRHRRCPLRFQLSGDVQPSRRKPLSRATSRRRSPAIRRCTGTSSH